MQLPSLSNPEIVIRYKPAASLVVKSMIPLPPEEIDLNKRVFCRTGILVGSLIEEWVMGVVSTGKLAVERIDVSGNSRPA